MPTLKSVKSLWYRALRGAPLTPRTRYRPPSSSPSFVLHPRLPPSFSILVSIAVLHPRHRYRPPSRLRNRSPSLSPKPSSVPSPLPFSILVFSPFHRIRLRYRSPSSFSAALFFGDVTKNMCKKTLSLNNRVFFKITDYISGL